MSHYGKVFFSIILSFYQILVFFTCILTLFLYNPRAFYAILFSFFSLVVKRYLTHRNYETIRTHDDTQSSSLCSRAKRAYRLDPIWNRACWCENHIRKSSWWERSCLQNSWIFHWILPSLYTWIWETRFLWCHEGFQHQNKYLATYVRQNRWIAPWFWIFNFEFILCVLSIKLSL